VIEHPAVLEPVKALAKQGVEVTYLPVKANGIIDTAELKRSIKDNTVLVSLMYVNSEVGSVQPIREVGKIIKKINENRFKQWRETRPAIRGARPSVIYFHTTRCKQ
ncbi:aminotransferase class V-fold PLP-dependent enzyme, partial [Candidatus Falkowbacteria bacterium]|nr:aminotransferase class V-fold PLP-dependent enzyme [Candidatus Falkowbacteria bacterium]